MTIECSDKMGKHIMSFIEGMTNVDADLCNEACEMVKKAKEQEQPLLCADLTFTYRKQKFELANMVPLTNQRLRDKSYGEKTFGGYLHDKYALFALHNDPDNANGATQLFLQWWFGSEYDLNPGEPVPEHVLDEIDKRWDEIQRTLYGNEAKQKQALDQA